MTTLSFHFNYYLILYTQRTSKKNAVSTLDFWLTHHTFTPLYFWNLYITSLFILKKMKMIKITSKRIAYQIQKKSGDKMWIKFIKAIDTVNLVDLIKFSLHFKCFTKWKIYRWSFGNHKAWQNTKPFPKWLRPRKNELYGNAMKPKLSICYHKSINLMQLPTFSLCDLHRFELHMYVYGYLTNV